MSQEFDKQFKNVDGPALNVNCFSVLCHQGNIGWNCRLPSERFYANPYQDTWTIPYYFMWHHSTARFLSNIIFNDRKPPCSWCTTAWLWIVTVN